MMKTIFGGFAANPKFEIRRKIKKLERVYDRFAKKIVKLSIKQDKLIKDATARIEELKIRAVRAKIE